MKTKVQQDPFHTKLTQNNIGRSAIFTQHDRVWFLGKKIYLSPNSTLILAILAENHSSSQGGYFEYDKTLSQIQQILLGLEFILFSRNAYLNVWIFNGLSSTIWSLQGLLQPLPIPNQVWTEIFMDFVEGFLVLKGLSAIMVIVNRLSNGCQNHKK